MIQAIFNLPVEELVDFSTSDGDEKGDKKILRKILQEFGLCETAKREKRAAQFGSRMSKLIKSSKSGTDEFILKSSLIT